MCGSYQWLADLGADESLCVAEPRDICMSREEEGEGGRGEEVSGEEEGGGGVEEKIFLFI